MPQQVFDLSDEETICQLAFNTQWHYTLNITEDSDAAKYLSQKTLWKIRSIAVNHGLDTSSFERTTEKLRAIFDVDTKNSVSILYILNQHASYCGPKGQGYQV